MNQLTPENVNAFLERFGEFGDSVLLTIAIDTRYGSRNNIVDVKISATHDEETDIISRVNVHLHLTGVDEFRIDWIRNVSHSVMSFGLLILFPKERIWLDLSPNYDPENPPTEDYEPSDLYFSAKACAWEVISYADWWPPDRSLT